MMKNIQAIAIISLATICLLAPVSASAESESCGYCAPLLMLSFDEPVTACVQFGMMNMVMQVWQEVHGPIHWCTCDQDAGLCLVIIQQGAVGEPAEYEDDNSRNGDGCTWTEEPGPNGPEKHCLDEFCDFNP